MPKFDGQTDKVLTIKLKSGLEYARWGLVAVAAGGEIPMEVMTQFVADGSDIKLTVKDMEGKVIDSLSGKVYNNYHRTLYSVTKPNKTGGMLFEAELSAHGLKGISPRIKVLPPVQITDLKWADEKGAAIKELTEGLNVELSAKIKGPIDGTEAYISINCKKSETNESIVATLPTKIKVGKVSVKWKVKLPGGPEDLAIKKELDKLGLKYYQPIFQFEAGCFGASALSAEQKLITWIEFTFGPPPKADMKRTAFFEMPDGTEKKESVPDDGVVKVAITMPGTIVYKKIEVDG